MRATLEQLKAMGDRQLYIYWMEGGFPFDVASPCGKCLLQHHPRHNWGGCHPEIGQVVGRMARHAQDEPMVITTLRTHMDELYALRLFYDSLYPQTVEAAEEKTIAESAPSLVAQG